LRDAVSTFDAFYVLIDLIDLDDELTRRAGHLAEAHGLRGGDAVHLAAATRLHDANVVVVAGDAALLGAAAAEGMAVADVA
jgi:predicted nucleic acid-binding protein